MIGIILNKTQSFSILTFHHLQHMGSTSWSKVAVQAPATLLAFHLTGRGNKGE